MASSNSKPAGTASTGANVTGQPAPTPTPATPETETGKVEQAQTQAANSIPAAASEQGATGAGVSVSSDTERVQVESEVPTWQAPIPAVPAPGQYPYQYAQPQPQAQQGYYPGYQYPVQNQTPAPIPAQPQQPRNYIGPVNNFGGPGTLVMGTGGNDIDPVVLEQRRQQAYQQPNPDPYQNQNRAQYAQPYPVAGFGASTPEQSQAIGPGGFMPSGARAVPVVPQHNQQPGAYGYGYGFVAGPNPGPQPGQPHPVPGGFALPLPQAQPAPVSGQATPYSIGQARQDGNLYYQVAEVPTKYIVKSTMIGIENPLKANAVRNGQATYDSTLLVKDDIVAPDVLGEALPRLLKTGAVLPYWGPVIPITLTGTETGYSQVPAYQQPMQTQALGQVSSPVYMQPPAQPMQQYAYAGQGYGYPYYQQAPAQAQTANFGYTNGNQGQASEEADYGVNRPPRTFQNVDETASPGQPTASHSQSQGQGGMRGPAPVDLHPRNRR